MTEVPEHLLQRSRERRAALGGESAPPAAPAGGGDSGGGEPGGAVATTAAAPAPAVVEEVVPPRPLPPEVQAALSRKKLPRWMPPVGVAALLWTFVYAGVLFSPGVSISDPVLLQGKEIFATQCSGCHGAGGEGGTGRPLAGQALLTFPKIADHLAWIHHGSPAKGTPYGDPNRPGGQHISQDNWGAMPAFGQADGGPLSDDEICAVARYEREVLNTSPPEDCSSTGGAAAGTTETTEGGSASTTTTEAGGGGSSGTNTAQSQGGKTESQSSSTTTTTTTPK
jgi:mono/diheme cytochrome c family protein